MKFDIRVFFEKSVKKIQVSLTPILLTWRIWRVPSNASKWQMVFNSEFEGLKYEKNEGDVS
jgi:hypothetical protein